MASILKVYIDELQDKLKNYDKENQYASDDLKMAIEALQSTISSLSKDDLRKNIIELKSTIDKARVTSEKQRKELSDYLIAWDKDNQLREENLKRGTEAHRRQMAEISKKLKPTVVESKIGFDKATGKPYQYITYNGKTLKKHIETAKASKEIEDLYAGLSYNEGGEKLSAAEITERQNTFKNMLSYKGTGKYGIKRADFKGKDWKAKYDMAMSILQEVQKNLKVVPKEAIGDVSFSQFASELDKDINAVKSNSSLDKITKKTQINEIIKKAVGKLRKANLSQQEREELVSKVYRGARPEQQQVNVEGEIYKEAPYYSDALMETMAAAFPHIINKIVDKETRERISKMEGLSNDSKLTAGAKEFISGGRLYQKDVFELAEEADKISEQRRKGNVGGNQILDKSDQYEGILTDRDDAKVEEALTLGDELNMLANRAGRIVDFAARTKQTLKEDFDKTDKGLKLIEQINTATTDKDFEESQKKYKKALSEYSQEKLANIGDEALSRTLFEKFMRSERFYGKKDETPTVRSLTKLLKKQQKQSGWLSDEEQDILDQFEKILAENDRSKIETINNVLAKRYATTQERIANTGLGFPEIKKGLATGDYFGLKRTVVDSNVLNDYDFTDEPYGETQIGVDIDGDGKIDYVEAAGFSSTDKFRQFGYGGDKRAYLESKYADKYEQKHIYAPRISEEEPYRPIQVATPITHGTTIGSTEDVEAYQEEQLKAAQEELKSNTKRVIKKWVKPIATKFHSLFKRVADVYNPEKIQKEIDAADKEFIKINEQAKKSVGAIKAADVSYADLQSGEFSKEYLDELEQQKRIAEYNADPENRKKALEGLEKIKAEAEANITSSVTKSVEENFDSAAERILKSPVQSFDKPIIMSGAASYYDGTGSITRVLSDTDDKPYTSKTPEELNRLREKVLRERARRRAEAEKNRQHTNKDDNDTPIIAQGNLPAVQANGDIIIQSSQPIEVTAEEVKSDGENIISDVEEVQRIDSLESPVKKRRGSRKKKGPNITPPTPPTPPSSDDGKIYDVHLRGKSIFGPEVKQAQKVLEAAGYIIRSIRANDIGEFIGFDLGKKSKRGKGTVDARTTNKKLLEALEQHLFPQVDRIDKNVDSIAKNGIKTSGGGGGGTHPPRKRKPSDDIELPWELDPPVDETGGTGGDEETKQESRKREYLELLRKQYAYQLEINKLEQESYIAGQKGDTVAVENRQKRIDGLVEEQKLLKQQGDELYDTLSAKHKKSVKEEERIQQIRLKTQSNLAGYTGAGAFGVQTGVATVTVEDQAQAEKEYEKALNDVLRIQKQIYATKHQADVSTGKEKQVNEALIPILQEQLNISAQQVKNLEKSNLLRPKQMKAIQAQFELDVATAEAQEKTRKGGAGNLFDVIANDVRRATMRITDFGLAAKALNSIPQSIQRVKQLTGQLEEALMNLRVVAELNREEGEALILTYAKMGKELGASTTEVSQSGNEWLRQGYNLQEANKLIASSTKLAKLGMISQNEATKSLTSALKGFGLEASNALSIVDKLTKVDSAAAVSAGEIATALSKSSVSARLAGMSMDELIASVSVIGEVTQNSMDSVGVAMKSLLARYGNVKAGVFSSMGLDDDGETTENINDIEKVLGKLGIRVRSSNLEMRSLSDVLDELNEKWSTYDTVTKNAIATAFGGRYDVATIHSNMNYYAV